MRRMDRFYEDGANVAAIAPAETSLNASLTQRLQYGAIEPDDGISVPANSIAKLFPKQRVWCRTRVLSVIVSRS